MECGGPDVGEDGDVGGGVVLCAGGEDGLGGGEAMFAEWGSLGP